MVSPSRQRDHLGSPRLNDATHARFEREVEWIVGQGNAASGLRTPLGGCESPEVTAVDENLRKKVIQHCTNIGMLMEDASAPAIMCAGLNETELRHVVDELVAAIGKMQALAASAAALLQDPDDNRVS